MSDFFYRIHQNERLNLREGFGRQTTATDQTLSSPAVSVWSGVRATANTSTDFQIGNLAITATKVSGHDGFTHPPNQSAEYTLAPKSTVTGGRYIIKVQVQAATSTEVLVERVDLKVDTKGAT